MFKFTTHEIKYFAIFAACLALDTIIDPALPGHVHGLVVAGLVGHLISRVTP